MFFIERRSLPQARPSVSVEAMEITLTIPDPLAQVIGSAGDIERRALEALALEEFKLGHLTTAELRHVLGFETRYELDGFLKAHDVYEPYTLDDLERERRDLKRLGF
jgi:hypothetical protein